MFTSANGVSSRPRARTSADSYRLALRYSGTSKGSKKRAAIPAGPFSITACRQPHCPPPVVPETDGGLVMSRIVQFAVIGIFATAVAACGDRPVDRALTGGAIGAGGGALVG